MELDESEEGFDALTHLIMISSNTGTQRVNGDDSASWIAISGLLIYRTRRVESTQNVDFDQG